MTDDVASSQPPFIKGLYPAYHDLYDPENPPSAHNNPIPPRIPHTPNPRHQRGARSRDDGPDCGSSQPRALKQRDRSSTPDPTPATQLTHSTPPPNNSSVPRLAAMAESYDRERQNDSRLDELSAKVSALRGVTVDIYDNARAQDVIDNTVSAPRPMGIAVRYIFLHGHDAQGVRAEVRTHGGVGE
ncbi:hypothetical protein V501_06782 [Pseudogymnoascus sp. VKM F-4519 (FW-2642)]|nr:hypothetical protein V501_06782 [Pseudogymnoascus sp. VKM F-4519 (FW-2642)]